MEDDVRVKKIKNGYNVYLWEDGFEYASIYYAKDLAEVQNILYKFFFKDVG